MALRSTVAAGAALMLAPALWAQEPWQSNWDIFAQEIAPLLTGVAVNQDPTVYTNSRYGGREVVWEGTVLLKDFNSAFPNVGMLMNSRRVTLSNGQTTDLSIVILDVSRSLSQWRTVPEGTRQRFRARLGTDVLCLFTRSQGAWILGVFATDAEPVSTAPPAAVISLSAQGQTTGNGGVLTLTAEPGGSVPVTFTGSQSSAGSGTISAFEWRNNNALISTSSSFTASLSAAANDITLRVTNSAGVSNTASSRVVINFGAPTPAPVISEIVNGASLRPGASASTWLTIRGSALSRTTRIWQPRDFSGVRLPTSLDGVSVRINGRDAFPYYISPTQLNILSPDDAAVGPVEVVVTTPDGSVRSTVTLMQSAPALFQADPDNRRYAAAVHAGDGVLVGRAGLFAGGAVTTRPALPNNRVMFFGTGVNDTTPRLPASDTVSTPAPLANLAAVNFRIGGVRAVVEWAGKVGSGLIQFNVIIPNLPNGDHAVELEYGGFTSPSGVFITVGSSVTNNLILSPGTLSFNAVRGGSSPPPQTIQVTSTGAPLPFNTQAITGSGQWLQVTPSSGVTPATLLVTASPGNLNTGTFTGSIQVNSAPASNAPQQVNVALNVSGGSSSSAPRIDTVNPASAQANQTINLEINGSGLGNANQVVITPGQGITFSGLSAAGSQVSIRMTIAVNAAVGRRTLQVLTPQGTSNPLDFTVLPIGRPPAISNVTVSSRLIPGLSGLATQNFQFTFADPDGDIRNSPGPTGGRAALEVIARVPQNPSGCADIIQGAFLERPGVIASTIVHTDTFIWSTELQGQFQLEVTLIDSAGNRSNTVNVPSLLWHTLCRLAN